MGMFAFMLFIVGMVIYMFHVHGRDALIEENYYEKGINYNAELVNKTNKEVKFTFRSQDSSDQIDFIQHATVLPKEGTVHLTFFLIRKNNSIKKYKTEAVFEVIANGEVLSTATTSFFAQPEGND